MHGSHCVGPGPAETFANKFICAWGCQLGALQDLIFRLNRNKKDTRGLLRQYKPPFIITNAIRIAFFVIFTAAAFLWTADIVDPIVIAPAA